MDEVGDQLVVRLCPFAARFEKKQRVNEELGVDGEVWIKPVVCLGALDPEGFRESHDRSPVSGTRDAAIS